VVHGVSSGGLQTVSEEKALQKLYQTLNEWKIHPYMSVLKLPSLVDLQYKIGEVVLSTTSCPSIIISENTLVNKKNVLMVTLTTGIMFLLFTCVHFWVWGIVWRWSAWAPTAYEVVRDCRKFEKHCTARTCPVILLTCCRYMRPKFSGVFGHKVQPRFVSRTNTLLRSIIICMLMFIGN
jgi:hypothetical protein